MLNQGTDARVVLPPRVSSPVRLCVLGFALSLAIGAPAPAQTQSQLQQFLRYHQRSEERISAGDWDGAGRVLETVLDFTRQQRFDAKYEVATLDRLALVRLNQGRFAEAQTLYRESAEACGRARPSNQAEREGLIEMLFNAAMGTARACRLQDDFDTSQRTYREAAAIGTQHRNEAWVAQAQSELAELYVDNGDTEEALQILLPLIPLLERAANQERPRAAKNSSLANALKTVAVIYHDHGRYDLAEPYARRAVETIVATRGWLHSHTAQALQTLGRNYQLQNRLVEAEDAFRFAVHAIEQSADVRHLQGIRLRNVLAQVLLAQFRFEEAEKIARGVLTDSEAVFGADHSEHALHLLNLAQVLLLQEKFVESEPLIHKALAIQEQKLGPLNPQVAIGLYRLALLRQLTGDCQSSLELLKRVEEIHQQFPKSPSDMSYVHSLRAEVLHELGQVDEALDEMAKALEMIELQRSYISGVERERAQFFENFTPVYDTLVRWYAQAGDIESMFTTIELIKARTFVEELQLGNADLLAGLSPDLRARFEQREQQLRRRLTEAHAALDALEADSNGKSENARRGAASELFAAREALYQLLVEKRAASPAYRDLITNQSNPLSIAEAQDRLIPPGGVLFNYQIGNRQSYLMRVSREAVSIVPLEITAQQAQVLNVEPGPLDQDRLREILLSEDTGLLAALSRPKVDRDISQALHALYQVLIPAQDRQALAEGSINTLTILPDGLLSLLPFEALVVSLEPELKYLLEVGPPLNYAPSASVLLNLSNREAVEPTAAEPVLTLGDPNYIPLAAQSNQLRATSRALGTGEDRLRATLAPLPYSGREAHWVRQVFQNNGSSARLLIAQDATEGNLRRSISGRRIVHLACHGMAEQSYGNFFGCLALGAGNASDPSDDGLLYAADIYDLNLSGCELAILSACETNYGPQQTGEGVWTLSRAFLVSGARRVVASNWVVDDEAGATLISYFATYVAEQQAAGAEVDYARALQRAKQQVRKQDRWAHPFYWSSLVLIGPR